MSEITGGSFARQFKTCKLFGKTVASSPALGIVERWKSVFRFGRARSLFPPHPHCDHWEILMASPPALHTAFSSKDGTNQFIAEVRRRIATVVVGQDVVVERMLVALFTGGHLLLQGVPGLAKIRSPARDT